MATIEIDVPECPIEPAVVGVDGIPSWVIGWGYFAGILIVLALITAVTIGMHYYRAEKTKRLKNQQDNDLALAKEHKRCLTCGDVYDPVAKDKKG